MWFDLFAEHLLRSDVEHEAYVKERRRPQSYMDPQLASDRKLYLRIVASLRDKGMVRFTRHHEETCGLLRRAESIS